MRLSFLRTQDDCVTISEDIAKRNKVQITTANLYIRKMVVDDNVVSTIERTSLKYPAMYRYNEVIAEKFLASSGQPSWKHEGVFTKEPIRR